jgi:hypothetical protein
VLESLGKQPGTGGFAIRTRDADYGDSRRRRTKETISDCPDVLAQLWNGGHEDVGSKVRLRVPSARCVFVQHGACAERDRLRRELQSVAGTSAAGEE